MKRILVMILCVLCFFSVNAQRSKTKPLKESMWIMTYHDPDEGRNPPYLVPDLTMSELMGGKFIVIDGTIIGDNQFDIADTTIYTFDKRKQYSTTHMTCKKPPKGHEAIDKTFQRECFYYLTNTIPQKFEYSKVGKASSGKYIVMPMDEINSKPNHFEVWEITQNDSDKKVFTLRKFPIDDYIGARLGAKKYYKKVK